MKESLCEYPFPNSRISIKLFVYNSLENSKLHKEITVTSLDRNLITYKKDASLSSYTLLLKETWDEAVNMIHADKNIKNKDEDLIHSSL